jgi:major membrane immunogen (membrane-anchored lipoprotein)
MKKLILILSLLPFISFSQVILDKVDIISFNSGTYIDSYRPVDKITIEITNNNYITITDNGVVENYKITHDYKDDKGNLDKTIYGIDYKGVFHDLYVMEIVDYYFVSINNPETKESLLYMKKR